MTQAMAWEIYSVGETADVGWSWRCYRDGVPMRRGVLMFPEMQSAVQDAIDSGMDTTLHRCRIIGMDGARDIPPQAGNRTILPMLSNTAEPAFKQEVSGAPDFIDQGERASPRV